MKSKTYQSRPELLNCICAIYAATKRSIPEQIGTGTLIELGGARFLITAAHVYDTYYNRRAEAYISGGGILLPLTQSFYLSRPPTVGGRDKDFLDFAFLRLSEQFADQIAKGHTFLPANQIAVNDQIQHNTRYMFTGLPASKSKTNYSIREVEPKTFSFSHQSVSIERMQNAGLDALTHIVIQFERENALNRAGEKVIFPIPNGMSGGPVWRGDGRTDQWFSNFTARLVGLGTEYRDKEQMMVGVRIHIVLDAIADAFDDIKAHVPKRSIGNNMLMH